MSGLLFWLIAGHFVMDYPLQPDFIAKHKCRCNNLPAVPWWYVMTGHACTHGLFVAGVTGFWVLGLAETVVHWLIDWAKCEKLFGIHVDQFLHVFCKLCWVVVASEWRSIL